MENITILLISRPLGVYKWIIENGLVVSSWGGNRNAPLKEPCTPREFLRINNIAWQKNKGVSEVWCAQIMTRVDNPEGVKDYRWVIDERIDKN
jgi:hypothetical protein